MVRLGTSEEAKRKTILSHEAPINEQSKHAMVRVATLITTTVETKSLVVVVTSKCGIMTIEQVQTDKLKQFILAARGVHQACTNVPIRILDTVFSKMSVVLHKQMCIALGAGPLECILVPQRNYGSETTVDKDPVHYKAAEDLQM